MNQAHFADALEYIPYRGLHITWSPSQRTLTLQLPWISIDVDACEEQLEKIQATTKDLNKGFQTRETSKFLEHFSDYPVAHIAPRKLKKKFSPNALEAAKADTWHTPKDLINQIAPELSTLVNPPTEWAWVTKTAQERSHIKGSNFYDPLSLYTHLRELRLSTQQESSQDAQLLSALEHLQARNEESFFKAMTTTLSQTYYVTQNCLRSLEPALMSPISLQVKKFMESEQGHDSLVLDSLRALGGMQPTDTEVFPETKLCMKILEFAAKNQIVAFCCLIGAFEGNDHADEDPMATLLQKSSRPNSARGIQRHYLINKNGNHAAIGEEFARSLGPIHQNTVIATTKITELLNWCQSSLLSQLNTKLMSAS